MFFITDANGTQLQVDNVSTSLSRVDIFLTDTELLSAMTAEEIMYYQDLKEKLLQLQLTEGTRQ